MTALRAAIERVAAPPVPRLTAPALLAGLAVAVWLRAAATLGGVGDPLSIGLAFGIGLAALAVAGGSRLERPSPAYLWAGLAGAAAAVPLIGIALIARLAGPHLPLAPAAPFAAWAAVTIVVATSEELLLRGALFDAVDRRLGVWAALGVTSIAFALMHVPLYGWHVVPLDLGVGLWFGGLRLVTRSAAAPAVAHAVADLATWWL